MVKSQLMIKIDMLRSKLDSLYLIMRKGVPSTY